MKITDPFGMKGWLEASASYKVGAKTGALSPSSSGKAEATVKVPWKPNQSFGVWLVVSVKYELFAFGSQSITDDLVHSGNGRFGAVAEWRVYLSENGVEMQPSGNGAHGGSPSKGDISVAATGGLVSNSFAKEKKHFVRWTVILYGGRQSKGLDIGYSGVGTSIGGDASTGNTQMLDLKLNLDVEEAPAPPEVEKKTVKILKLKIGTYDHGKVKTEMITKSTPGFKTWKEFRDLIKDGKLLKATREEWGSSEPRFLKPRTIRIIGYADTTGPMSENDIKYGKGRAEDVKKWIKAWTGAADDFFFVKSEGEGSGATDKKSEEKKLALNRYVELQLSYLA